MICPSCKAQNDASAESCFTCGKSLGTLTLGSVVGNRYEILDYIGRGGMGMIYKAHDRVLDEIVALKTLRPQIANDQDMVKRFVAEIKLARKIRHRNVCAIHDYGQDGSLIYISMEYIEGIDLKKILTEKGPFPPQEAFEIAIQVAKGLEAIHEAGVIHRDLKTHNLMRDSRGVVKLLDFGIAKQQDKESGMTGTGQLVGTPEYMSPEQVRGKAIDHRSDLYALGIVVFEAFTGQVPFHGDTPIITLFKHLEEPPPLTGPRARLLPHAAVPVLARMLAKAPADRYATAGDIIEALRQARTEAFPESLATPAPFAAPAMPDMPSGVVARPAMPTPLPQAMDALQQQARAGATPTPHKPTPVAPTPPPIAAVVPAPTPIPAASAVPAAPDELEATIRRPPPPRPSPPPAPPTPAQAAPVAVPPPPPTPAVSASAAPPVSVPEPAARAVTPVPDVEATVSQPPVEARRKAEPAAPARRAEATHDGGTRTLPAPAAPRPEPPPPPAAPAVPPAAPTPSPHAEAPPAIPRPAAPATASRGPLIGVAAAVVVAAGVGGVFLMRSGPETPPTTSAASLAPSGPVVQDVVVPGSTPSAPAVRIEDAEAVAAEPAGSGATDVRPVATPAPTVVARAEPVAPAVTQPPAPAPGTTSRPTLGSAPAPAPNSAAPGSAGTAAPTTAAPAPPRVPAGPARSFQPGRSRIDSLRAAKGGGPKGFDLGDAAVKSSAEFEGTLDFEFSPATPRAGEPFSVKIFLNNTGKKDADIKIFTLSPIVNGTRSTLNPKPLVDEVKKGARTLVYEYSGTWKDEKSWELEAIVTTSKQDVCRNRLTWK